MMLPIFVLCILAAAMVLRVRGRKGPGRSLMTLLLLGAAVGVILDRGADIGGMRVKRSVRAVLIDLSDSMSVDPAEPLAPGVWYPWTQSGADHLVVVGFARIAAVLYDGSDLSHPERLQPPVFSSSPANRDIADMNVAVAALMPLLEDGDRVELVVVSDGGLAWTPPLFSDLDERRSIAITMRLHAPDRSLAENVSVRFTEVPPSVTSGGAVDAMLCVDAVVGSAREVTVVVNDVVRASVTVSEIARRVTLCLRVPIPTGTLPRLVARLEGQDGWDRRASDDRHVVDLDIVDKRPRVGLATDDGRLTALYRELLGPRADVFELDPERDLTSNSPDIVIVAEADLATPARIAATRGLAAFVARGGGLVLAGIDRAFGNGHWSKTPIDDLSPLEADPADAGIDVLVCLDRSGSMDRDGRYGDAIAAVGALSEALGKDDRLVVLAFTVDVDEERFDPGTSSRDVVDRLERRSPGGGTDVDLVMRRALERPIASGRQKVILVLSDMQSATATTEHIESWSELARSRTTAVNLLWFDRDERLRPMLEKLAKSSGGTLREVESFRALARPMIEAARRGLVVDDALVSIAGGSVVSMPRIIRTRPDEGVALIAGGADLAAAAEIRRGLGHVLALACDADPDVTSRLFGGRDALVSAILSTQGPSSGHWRVELEEGLGRCRRRVLTESDVVPAFLFAGGESRPIERIGPSDYATSWEDGPVSEERVTILDRRGAPIGSAFSLGSASLDESDTSRNSRAIWQTRLERAALVPDRAGVSRLVFSVLAVLIVAADILLRGRGE